jgi:hypothetical protein
MRSSRAPAASTGIQVASGVRSGGYLVAGASGAVKG